VKTIDVLRRHVPLVTVVGFVIACLVGLGFLWVKSGGGIPGITPPDDYTVSFQTTDLKNLRDIGEVRIAGVKVGKVLKREQAGDNARVVLSLDSDAAPLHRGAKVRIGVRTPIGASYVDIVDGRGQELPAGATLPPTAVKPAVDVDELFSTLDPATRKSLRGMLRSLGEASAGTENDLRRAVNGLGHLGNEGHTVLDALAAQSGDLQALTVEGKRLLDTLDTGRGQIATVVQDAQRLTGATAGKRERIEQTMRALPGMLAKTKGAAGKLAELSGPLTPVAADLRQAAPDLTKALRNLPAASEDLRALLPDLDATLDRAPATLKRVPAFSEDVRALVPEARALLRDVNPMLAYLKPYGRDLGALFANWGATFEVKDSNGINPIRLGAVFNAAGVRGNPVPLGFDPTHWVNPYPGPGQAGDPAPFQGEYPRVEREPK